MTYTYYQLDEFDLTNHANMVKELLFTVLQKDGVIDDWEKESEKYAVILVKKGWFGQVLDRVWNTSKVAKFQVVRVIE